MQETYIHMYVCKYINLKGNGSVNKWINKYLHFGHSLSHKLAF